MIRHSGVKSNFILIEFDVIKTFFLCIEEESCLFRLVDFLSFEEIKVFDAC
jgi:hypothetical protein